LHDCVEFGEPRSAATCCNTLQHMLCFWRASIALAPPRLAVSNAESNKVVIKSSPPRAALCKIEPAGHDALLLRRACNTPARGIGLACKVQGEGLRVELQGEECRAWELGSRLP